MWCDFAVLDEPSAGIVLNRSRSDAVRICKVLGEPSAGVVGGEALSLTKLKQP